MYIDSIAKIIAERTGCDISAVKPESTFTELGIDSLDTVELLMNLEDELGMDNKGATVFTKLDPIERANAVVRAVRKHGGAAIERGKGK